MNKLRVALLASLTVLALVSSGTAEETMKVNIVSYQPPIGLIDHLIDKTPDGVEYNQSKWIGVSDADIIIYFMSSFDAKYEITDFGSRILDTIDYDPDNSAIVTQSVNLESLGRIVYVVYVSASMFDGSLSDINLSTASVVETLAGQMSKS